MVTVDSLRRFVRLLDWIKLYISTHEGQVKVKVVPYVLPTAVQELGSPIRKSNSSASKQALSSACTLPITAGFVHR